jgi:hypothetical protein
MVLEEPAGARQCSLEMPQMRARLLEHTHLSSLFILIRQRLVVLHEDGPLGEGRDVIRLGDGDCQAVAAVDVQHDVHIRAPVPHIHDAVGADLQR